MQSIQWCLTDSESTPRQSTETSRSAAYVPGKQTTCENAPSDRQTAAEATYAAFVWLFGPGCI